VPALATALRNYKRLFYRKAIRRAAAETMQRDVADSIATLRDLVVRGCVRRLDRCRCCAMFITNFMTQ